MTFMSKTGAPPAQPAAAGGSPIGQSLPRKEDDRLLRGGGLYADDVDLPRQAEMAVARCPFPHARIRSIDTAAARALPGVVQIFTGADMRAISDPISVLRPVPGAPSLPYFALAQDVALHEGHAVVSVVAESRAIAEDAIELLEIDFEPLPHVTDMRLVLEPDAPVLHPGQMKSNLMASKSERLGAPEEKLAGAAVIERDRFLVNRVAPLSMEPRGVVVSWRAAARELEFRSSTQVPHLVRKQLAESLRLEESAIRVVASDVGGAYGMKLGFSPKSCWRRCMQSRWVGRSNGSRTGWNISAPRPMAGKAFTT